MSRTYKGSLMYVYTITYNNMLISDISIHEMIGRDLLYSSQELQWIDLTTKKYE